MMVFAIAGALSAGIVYVAPPAHAQAVPLPRRNLLTQPANPGASSSVTVYDTGSPSAAQGNAYKMRVRTAVYTNVADAGYVLEWQARGSASWRTVDSATIPATTYFQRDALIQPGRCRVRLTTVTNPSTWEAEAEVLEDATLGQ